ncbi:MAG: hypothetical protein WA876_16560 [Candidatus Acidiferrales bacterium]
MSIRECPFCGKSISDAFRDCPHCHEALPERRVPSAASASRAAAAEHRPTAFRRGLLYMMAVAFVYYLLSPVSPLKLPVPFAPILTRYLLPSFFLAGMAFALFGIYQYVRE